MNTVNIIMLVGDVVIVAAIILWIVQDTREIREIMRQRRQRMLGVTIRDFREKATASIGKTIETICKLRGSLDTRQL